ncbi:MAG TPA: Stp1/IreP family PP2C-type Ser/Thr phosphatase [Desulfuromonadales bacterium]|nr:Stp1/IreP family PP2C-type Ser/Thr phosphatase [Desulfuromonadales bacterium]
MPIIETAGATDVGLRRSNNEDAFVIMADKRVVSVADGMGGAAAGEVASNIFVTAVQDFFGAACLATEDAVYQLVKQTFNAANNRIIEHVIQNPDNAGMGCTGELLAFVDGRYIIGHVGDSRIYLFRNGELRQLTKDHSLVQMQLDGGAITAEEARVHPKRNIVLRVVGMELDFSLDILRGNTFVHDLFLLCSDGLTDMIEDTIISAILLSSLSLDHKAEQLIEAAKKAGGKDNITVVLCKINET